jgi:hypothetical protein
MSMGRGLADATITLACARARRRALVFVPLLALAAPLTLASAAAAAAPLLPDLVSDPPGPSEPPELYTDAQGSRLLMRLDGFVHNRGPGPLEIRGSRPLSLAMSTVVQRVYDDAGGFADHTRASGPRLLFERADGHNHWHLKDAMRYSLWSADGTREVAPAQKVGFCLVDSQAVEATSDEPVYSTNDNDFCAMSEPAAPEVYMGVSAGWRDLYGSSLPFQWVDISDVEPGQYRLRADTDPDEVIEEGDEVNPSAYAMSESVVNGYVARPVARGNVSSLLPSTIRLNASTFDDAFPGRPGPRQFRIVTPPSKGRLSQPTGAWFSASQVVYMPTLGAGGADSFTFTARDSTSAFPRNPRSAAVTLTIKGLLGASARSLAVSGAPQQAPTSSTMRLTATGSGTAGGVRWSVDGVDGGNAIVGTVSADGRYRAPASVPPRERVVIAATSPSGARAATILRIVSSRAVRPAPSVAPPAAPRHGLSRLVLARQMRTLTARVVTGRYGLVRVVARRAGIRIGGCAIIARRGMPVTCAMKLDRSVAPDAFICRVPKTRGLRLPGVRVTAALSARGRVLAIRHARAR